MVGYLYTLHTLSARRRCGRNSTADSEWPLAQTLSHPAELVAHFVVHLVTTTACPTGHPRRQVPIVHWETATHRMTLYITEQLCRINLNPFACSSQFVRRDPPDFSESEAMSSIAPTTGTARPLPLTSNDTVVKCCGQLVAMRPIVAVCGAMRPIEYTNRSNPC